MAHSAAEATRQMIRERLAPRAQMLADIDAADEDDLMNDPRIDAAASAIYEAWVAAAHPAMRWLAVREEWADEARGLAHCALAAADAAEAGALAQTRSLLEDCASAFDIADIQAAIQAAHEFLAAPPTEG